MKINIFLSVLLLSTFLYAQETLTEVQREMARIEKEINREKALHQSEQVKAKDFEVKKVEKDKALLNQIKMTESKVDEAKNELSKIKGQKAQYQSKNASWDKKRTIVAADLMKSIDQWMVLFKSDFPRQQEKRIQQLSNIREQLKQGNMEVDEAMNQVFAVLNEAVDMGYDTETYSAMYTSKEGKQTEGTYLRVGAVIQVFVSLDEKIVAYILNKNAGTKNQDNNEATYIWIEDPPPQVRQNIKQAISIAQGKTAPVLISLPLAAPIHSEAGGL